MLGFVPVGEQAEKIDPSMLSRRFEMGKYLEVLAIDTQISETVESVAPIQCEIT